MFKKFSVLTLSTLTLTAIFGASAMASSIDCKVSGVDTRVTVVGHGAEGPAMTEYKTVNESTEVTVFTDVVASHSAEGDCAHLVVTGNRPNGSARLDIHEVTAHDPSAFAGTYSDLGQGRHVDLPVQCTGKE